jgi:hypothetical protein
VDIVRVAMYCGAFVPLLILPWVKYASALFGATKEVVVDGFNYVTISLGESIISCIYMGLGDAYKEKADLCLWGLPI